MQGRVGNSLYNSNEFISRGGEMETEWYVRYNEDTQPMAYELLNSSGNVEEMRVTGNGMIAELMDRGVSRSDAAELVVKAAQDAGIPV